MKKKHQVCSICNCIFRVSVYGSGIPIRLGLKEVSHMTIMKLRLQSMTDNVWHRPDGVRRQLLYIVTREESVVPFLKNPSNYFCNLFFT